MFSVFAQHNDAIAEQSREDQIEDEGAIFEGKPKIGCSIFLKPRDGASERI